MKKLFKKLIEEKIPDGGVREMLYMTFEMTFPVFTARCKDEATSVQVFMSLMEMVEAMEKDEKVVLKDYMAGAVFPQVCDILVKFLKTVSDESYKDDVYAILKMGLADKLADLTVEGLEKGTILGEENELNENLEQKEDAN